MTESQRKTLESSAVVDRPLGRAIKAALRRIDELRDVAEDMAIELSCGARAESPLLRRARRILRKGQSR